MSAQTPLQAQLTLRPITRDDISTYKLASTTQVSGGLRNVGLGQPAYLEVLINKAIPATQIASVTWTLTSQPSGSKAVLQDSPLGSNVLPFEPADQAAYQVAGRKMLKPDVGGVYSVGVTVTTAGSGTATVYKYVIGATYVGYKVCAGCHDGRLLDDKMTSWAKSGHAHLFQEGIDGRASDHYSGSCIACHTLGYDTTEGVNNNGFSQIAAKLNWTFPTPAAGNYDKLPDQLKDLGSIQCENCHGPGSRHVSNGGNSMLISRPTLSGACAACHGAMTHHFKMGEWTQSRHAIATSYPTGPGREACVSCHSAPAFINKMKGFDNVDTSYAAVNCAACHDAHGKNDPEGGHLVRQSKVTLAEGTVVQDGGKGMLCMNCHQARVNASTYVTSTAGSARFGPHHGPQADMLAGVNGVTYGMEIPSSAHGSVVEDSCVTCHMQTVAESSPAFTRAGGHTFRASADATGSKAAMDLVGACQGCHGKNLKRFDFTLFDYDGDGKIEGVQAEVQHLLDKLSSMLPPDNKSKTSLAIDASWTPKQLKAGYNWLFVTEDRSKGVHNTAYAVGLLKASIADLSAK